MNNTKILFAKLRKDALIPTKRDEDGCYDLYACFTGNEIVIQPHTTKLIPTGLISAFSKKRRIAFRERGSNTKSNLLVMAGQIDSGYRGEYFVGLHNLNNIPVEISKTIDDFEVTPDFIRVPYSKAICQFAVENVPRTKIIETSVNKVLSMKSDRGIGKLGSSNK